ncbi:hypothetical protein GALMADRAFT_255349 [Galerina marginata CBS 339.88]|uniref:F-box domain-containing protein n=1 Tax=Galerina marginata (strain CBS 339.88) TaxID=685588 RepID=A0A067SGF0_GALM3|nr:hypothetical protein GALMADRAFT_255349 [Galerina marginata CBS 339.88]
MHDQRFPVELPAELSLLIISYLPLSSLAVLHQLNRSWSDFLSLQENEDAVYRAAAVREGYVGAALTGVRWEAQAYSEKAMRDVDSWKIFCKKRKMITSSWAGYAPSRITPSPRQIGHDTDGESSPHYRRVYDIKVDEKAGISMATTKSGGLVVRDLETDLVLWELPVRYVWANTRLEYGEGYLIFDHGGAEIEVWRRTADIPVPSTANSGTVHLADENREERQCHPELQFNPASIPNERQRSIVDHIYQLSVSPASIPTQSSISFHNSSKGAFTPHAVLHMPDFPLCAFRFVYPELLVASAERAHVWDVRSARVIECVEGIHLIHPAPGQHNEEHNIADHAVPIIPEPEVVDFVRSVDISPRHLCFAGLYHVRIFSRETGAFALTLPSTRFGYGRWRWEVGSRSWASAEAVANGEGDEWVDSYAKAKGRGKRRHGGSDIPREAVRVPVRFTDVDEEGLGRESKLLDEFVAVRFSGDGTHLATLLKGSRLVIIPHFEAFLGLPKTMKVRGGVGTSINHSHQNRKQNLKLSRPQAQTGSSPFQPSRELRRDQDTEIFACTLDIQLGAPEASKAMHLAYENGRFGVVTSNAIYVVVPNIPVGPPPWNIRKQKQGSKASVGPVKAQAPVPASRSTAHSLRRTPKSKSGGGPNLSDISPPSSSARTMPTSSSTPPLPSVKICRLPYFSNPSWLNSINCLAMSDTGLYVNWNPTQPKVVEEGLRSRVEHPDTVRKEQKMDIFERQATKEKWEREYQSSLEAYELDEAGRYRLHQNEDMFVLHTLRDLETSTISSIYTVDFAPGK